MLLSQLQTMSDSFQAGLGNNNSSLPRNDYWPKWRPRNNCFRVQEPWYSICRFVEGDISRRWYFPSWFCMESQCPHQWRSTLSYSRKPKNNSKDNGNWATFSSGKNTKQKVGKLNESSEFDKNLKGLGNNSSFFEELTIIGVWYVNYYLFLLH